VSSAENVELIRSLHPGPDVNIVALVEDEAAAGRLRDVIEHLFDPAIKATMRFPGLKPVTYAGLDGMHEAWRDWLKHRTSYKDEIEDVIGDGDRVLVVHRGYRQDSPDVPESVLRRVTVWTLQQGRIVGVDFNVPYADALPAVGAS
jgi:hypothetical protein